MWWYKIFSLTVAITWGLVYKALGYKELRSYFNKEFFKHMESFHFILLNKVFTTSSKNNILPYIYNFQLYKMFV